MHRPLGMIFDLFGTVLYQESIDALAGINRLLQFATNEPRLSAAEISLFADEIHQEIEQIRNESSVEFNFQCFQRILFENLGLTFKLSYAEMERVFWHASVKCRPADGIDQILDILDKNKIKSGILSNTCFTGKVLSEELVKHNLSGRFDFVIASADYGFRKPNPRIFQVAVKTMHLDARDIWFAGDKIDCDISGALNAGLYPVWYNPLGESVAPSYDCLTVRSWAEFEEKIKSICPPKVKAKIKIA